MKYTLEKIKQEIAEKINDFTGSELVQPADLAYPPNIQMGDLSLPCFVIAKNTGKNPAEVSSDLVSKFSALVGENKKIASVFSAGPYLNFKLNKHNLCEEVINDTKEAEYGANEIGEKQKVMIEFSNANTHKEFHVGHLRNLCYGDSARRIMNENGFEVLPVSYINDFGIHVAKTLWALQEFYKNDELPENKGEFLGRVYVRSNKETKDDPHKNDLVKFMMKKIESKKGEEYELWKKTREWSIEQMQDIYKDFGIEFVKTYYESEVIDEGREMIDDLLEKGILKMSQGAVIADLEQFDLGVLVFLRSDGTATYPVADIPLAMKKFKDFELDASIYVVDVRQELYFKQLFRVLKQMGYKKPMIHLGYDFVTLPDGMMSSRSGNVVTYEELKKMLEERIEEETKSRHSDWDQQKVDVVKKALTKAVIKFEMLKVGAKQTIVFDIEKALSFQGFTAAYLLYTCARINSIISKSDISKDKITEHDLNKNLNEEKEHEIVIKMAKYPDMVKLAGQNYDPSVIAKYVFELAQEFNDYYHAVKINDSEEKEARLALSLAVLRVLEKALSLLGIETIEEM